MKNITRRNIIKSATIGSGVALISAPAIAKNTIKWKMITTWPKNFPGLGTGAQRIADSITTMSDGQLMVKLYAAGELVPPFECFDAVRQGIAQMSHGASYYWISKNRSTPFFAAVPGGLTAQEHDAWIHYGGGQQLWDELYGEFGLKGFLAGNSGIRIFKPLKSSKEFISFLNQPPI